MSQKFSFVANAVGSQSKDSTLHIMTYELGKIVQQHHYSKVYGVDSSTTAYIGDGKVQTSNLISMIRYYCEQQGWDYDELQKLGEEHYLERMKDLREHGVKQVCSTPHLTSRLGKVIEHEHI